MTVVENSVARFSAAQTIDEAHISETVVAWESGLQLLLVHNAAFFVAREAPG